MKILLITLGSLAALIAIVAICGMMLPEKHTASRMARYRQPPEKLWIAIANYKGDESLGTKVEESDPPRRLVTRVIDPHHNFGGTWTWEIQPASDGSLLRITEDGEVYNPIFRFVSRFVIGHTKTMETALRSFGENVQIED